VTLKAREVLFIGWNAPCGEERRQRNAVELATYIVAKGMPLLRLVK